MTLLEILLILIGAVIIIFSFFLVDKSSVEGGGFSSNSGEPSKRDLSMAELAEMKEKIADIVTEISEETIEKTENQLSKLSNDKIIAVSDYSNQIIEKINQNHEEVVFLYSMLNDKESELKEIIKRVDLTKKQLLETDSSNVKNTKSKVITEQSKKNDSYIGLKELDESFQIMNSPLDEMNDNNNDKILSLHKNGKSIIEISKILGLGQGEVKLVIGLFTKK